MIVQTDKNMYCRGYCGLFIDDYSFNTNEYTDKCSNFNFTNLQESMSSKIIHGNYY